MANLTITSMKDEKKRWEEDRKFWIQWEKTRIIKRCKCGKKYSYGRGEVDPKVCAECR